MNYARWIAHFEANHQNRVEPDWDAPFAMPEEKRRLLAHSLAEYQLGDGGGPCKLIARDAEAYRSSARDIRRVVDMWFAEEAEHSRLLGCAVRRVGGEFVQETFAFRLFCWCRQWMGVQFEMLVLLLVEIVSTGYYRVIRKHVGDPPIADMCRLILRDETRHIDFHHDRLAARHPRGVSWLWRLRFRALGFACAWFLWLGHGRCLKALGGSRAELLEQVGRGMTRFLRALPQRSAEQPGTLTVSAPLAGRTH
jgi:hypothetical protein